MPASTSATAIDLDHLAIASEHAWDNFERYRGDLGGRYVGGMQDPGFWWCQVRFANGMRVELLEPRGWEEFDFLRRFLDRNGPGPHHYTFKVPDLAAMLERVQAAGYEPVGVRMDDDEWQEAFLHPRQTPGIVVQLAHGPDETDPANDAEATVELPPGRCPSPATLVRFHHLVASVDDALRLFEGVLDGEVTERVRSDVGDGADLRWPGPGRIRLIEPTERAAVQWLGGRAGRLHHLELAVADPAGVPGVVGIGEGVYELAPERNLGVRLRLRPA